MNLTWFYFHCVLALVILVKDYNGTLEESLDRFEKKIGLYTEPDTSTIDAPPPFYVPPIQDEESVIDSNFAEFDETR
tara:strand:- start:726 stop:956 length:231 start_codon:yes stop_codon:yes gene_type:complete